VSKWKRVGKSVILNAKIRNILDWTTCVALWAASPPSKFFARLGPARLPRSREKLKRMGIFPIRDHYHQPLFNDAHLTKPLSEVRHLPGIDWRHRNQVELLKSLCYAQELKSMELLSPASNETEFYMDNGAFESGDAEFFYSMLRFLKPRRLIEIGSGNSTKIARNALLQNALETGESCDHFCIEPYENPWLEQLGIKIIREPVEMVGLDVFQGLEAGDMLFIDSTHMIRPQGDVLFEYLQLLPSLASGVYVHVHDIFSPRDYPDQWVRNNVMMWNEQYLLEATMGNQDRYEVVAGLNYLKHTEFDLLLAVCPYLTKKREPGSFYLRIR
jgi:hypothetical protein